MVDWTLSIDPSSTPNRSTWAVVVAPTAAHWPVLSKIPASERPCLVLVAPAHSRDRPTRRSFWFTINLYHTETKHTCSPLASTIALAIQIRTNLAFLVNQSILLYSMLAFLLSSSWLRLSCAVFSTRCGSLRRPLSRDSGAVLRGAVRGRQLADKRTYALVCTSATRRAIIPSAQARQA